MATITLSERRFLNVKRRLDALMETIAGFVALIALNLVWSPENIGWTDTVLHPYYIVVLMIAARYGTIDGIVSGVLGASVYTWFRLAAEPEAFTGMSSILNLELMATPYMLILVGTVLGELRQVAQDEIDTLWTRMKRLRTDLDMLSGEARVVRQHNEDLQERIASSTQTTGAFYQVAASVQSLREEEALPSILDIVSRFVGAEKSAIYMLGPDGWELRLQSGWESQHEFTRTIAMNNPLLERVAEGEVVTMKDVTLDFEGTDIVMAAPLRRGDGHDEGKVIGAITVQSIPLAKLNLATIRNLEGISDWASKVLASAEAFERVKERDPADAITGTYRYAYMLRRLDEESGRWRRYHTPVTLLLLQVKNYERVPRIKRAAFLRRVGRLIMKNVRQVDMVARWKSANTFALILPSTDSGGARELVARITDQFTREVLADVPRSAELGLKFGIGTSGEHGDRREELVRSAEMLELS